jgi:hypothetical protein
LVPFSDPSDLAVLDVVERLADGELAESEMGQIAEAEHRPDRYPGESRPLLLGYLSQFAHRSPRLFLHNIFLGEFSCLGQLIRLVSGTIAADAFPAPGDGGTMDQWNATCRSVERTIANLLRDVAGPRPFRPVSLFSAWRTDTALSLARQMYESRDFSTMPILADALQDAGCDSPDVLDHCRDPNGTHVRGCWVVDLILGRD